MVSTNMESRGNGQARSMGDVAESVGQRIEKFTHDAGRKVGSMASRLQDGASEYVDTSRDYIKENPLQATAYAAAAGLAAGCLLTWALRRKQ